MRAWLVALALAAVVVGEHALAGRAGANVVAADALAGSAFLATGIVGLAARSSRRLALASYVAGLVWVLVNLAPGVEALHRPLLVLAVLLAASDRLAHVLAKASVALATAVALVAPNAPVLSVAVGVLVVAAGFAPDARRRGRPGRLRWTTMVAATALGAGIAGAALARLWVPVTTAAVAITIAYAALVAVAGAALLAGLLLRRGGPPALVDAVVELTELSSPALDTMVASLQDQADGGDAAAAQVLRSVARLLDDNDALHRAQRARVDEVRRSRRRLVEAADLERRRLARHLAVGAGRHLDELELTLAALAALPSEDEPLIDRLRDELLATRDDLDQLARGLHPRILVDGGLRASLDDLARRFELPTTVRVPDERFPPTVETTIWYVCAEAAANVVKHAAATTLVIDVDVEDDGVLATVADDGRGGAEPARGSGLRGLTDRVEAVGGRLELATRAGGGTELRVWVPIA